MARKLKSDKMLFLSTLLLLCVSVVMVYSTSTAVADTQKVSPLRLLLKQATWAALGMILMVGAARVDYLRLKKPAVIWTLLGLAVGSLLLVLVVGSQLNGSRRWLNFGSLGMQPSEFAKLAVVVFTAAILEQRRERINDVRYALTPIAVVLVVVAGLIYKEPDAGSAIVVAGIVGVMVFTAGLAYRYLVLAAGVGIPAGVAMILLEGYRYERLRVFWDPFKDAKGFGYQPIQAQMAVATGGAFGKGVGSSVQSLFYLPEAHNDFIYAIIGEELGLIGATVVLGCFAVLIWRGLRVAARAQDPFASLMATGIVTMIGAQALVNISMVIGLMPTKGIALPMVSAGGSSLLVSMLAIGILLNISQRAVPDA